MMNFNDKQDGYPAVVYVMENNNSVLIHFAGFEDLVEAKTFSSHIMNELGIERLFVPKGVTIH
jgi:hypothetical protein|tara:strand:- start:337 stop:525 length:189 start_codon:yes stop_codon:yes gene_type:complete